MELHVLGADGGEMMGFKPSSFLIDKSLLLDAGSVCSGLPLDELAAIDHILISHSHLDHIKDLGLLSDLLTGRRKSPVHVYSTATVLETLRKHYFNDEIWPDFTKIPDQMDPVMKLQEIQPLQPFMLDEYQVTAIPVNHTVECHGFLVTKDNKSLLYSADTGVTELLWEFANQTPNLCGLILDVAFPNRMQFLADLAKHLSPQGAAIELQKLKNKDLPVFFFHLKPAFHDELTQEIQQLLLDNHPARQILRSGARILLQLP